MSSRDWHVVRSTELLAPAKVAWEVVGGFFNIHTWHPDIVKTEYTSDQLSNSALRRVLTFPAQPETIEELVGYDAGGRTYSYRWVAGAWGEQVQNYAASIRVIATNMDEKSLVQWESKFRYTDDAVSQFYENGFRALRERFNRSR